MKMEKLIKDFPWIKNNAGLAYFDNSATSLKPQSVIDAIVRYYTHFSTNPHADDSQVQHEVVKTVERTREKIAKFINCDKEEIIFTSGATLSLNIAINAFAHNFKANDEIILSEADHSSALLPWYELRKNLKLNLKFVNLRNGVIYEDDILKMLSPKTKAVNITSASNTLGFLLDCNKLITKIKKYNKDILVIVDATQHLPHAKIDVKKMNCDFLVGSAHKLLGPTGIGMLYIKKSLQKEARPYITGGAMNFSIEKNDYTYMENVHKFEAGTPNAAGIYGFEAAIDYLNKIGIDNVYEHDKELKIYAINKLKEIKNLKIYNANTALGIITFNYEGVNAQDMAFYLGKKGIICRSGLSCSKLVKRPLNIEHFVRISFYIYNTKKEIDKLVKILSNFKKGEEISAIF